MARYRREIEAQESALSRTVIETIYKACPVCKGDVKGDDTYLFYCKGCNLLFRRDELFLENPERLRDVVESKILERYERDKDKLQIDHEPIKLKALKTGLLKAHHAKRPVIKEKETKEKGTGEKQKHAHKSALNVPKPIAKTLVMTHSKTNTHSNAHAKTLYVASKSRDKLHREDCQFVRNIDKSNKLTYGSIAEAKKDRPYKMCRCIK